MTIKEAKAVAADTVRYFLSVMPDAPFGEPDIIIEFSPKNKMAETYRALCVKHGLTLVMNDIQAEDINTNVAANALIGREKSAILIRNNSRNTANDWKRIVFHELTHIFCGKLEMDKDKHFLNVYVSGHTPDENPENKAYDGFLNAGYTIWSEFIAQYYALKYCQPQRYSYVDVVNGLMDTLSEVIVNSQYNPKPGFAYACAYLLNCEDAERTLQSLAERDFLYDWDEDHGENAQETLRRILLLLNAHIQLKKPWIIDEEFIGDVGSLYVLLLTANSMYLGILPEAVKRNEKIRT
jgi:hypothetical protein